MQDIFYIIVVRVTWIFCMLVSILRTTLRHIYTSLFTLLSFEKARWQRHCSTAQTLCPGLFGLSWHQLK